MQAIITKYIPCTDHRPSRIKASCDRGSITVSYNSMQGEGESAHVEAADQLCRKFIQEDVKRYGPHAGVSTWAMPRVCGGIPGGEYVHVFVHPGSIRHLPTETLARMEVA